MKKAAGKNSRRNGRRRAGKESLEELRNHFAREGFRALMKL